MTLDPRTFRIMTARGEFSLRMSTARTRRSAGFIDRGDPPSDTRMFWCWSISTTTSHARRAMPGAAGSRTTTRGRMHDALCGLRWPDGFHLVLSDGSVAVTPEAIDAVLKRGEANVSDNNMEGFK